MEQTPGFLGCQPSPTGGCLSPARSTDHAACGQCRAFKLKRHVTGQNSDLSLGKVKFLTVLNYFTIKLIFKKKERKKEGLSWWLSGKEFPCQCRRHGFDSWSGRIPHASEQLSLCSRAPEPQLLKPTRHRTCAPQEEPSE